MEENKEPLNDRMSFLEREMRELRNWTISHFANPLELIRRLGELESKVRTLEKELSDKRMK